jgi:tetratricopeptide (TPR) repeat protein
MPRRNMMRITRLILILSVICFTIITQLVNAQTIPEEARRHMARGQAAVEIAKSAEELQDAIKEFQQASSLVPDWPDPYYQMANLQEKTGKLKEALASLKAYLRLAPNAPDAVKIQEQIYKLDAPAIAKLQVTC